MSGGVGDRGSDIDCIFRYVPFLAREGSVLCSNRTGSFYE